MRYTDTVVFQHFSIGQQAHTLELPVRWVTRPFAGNPIWSRMHQVFDLEHFLYAAPPVDLGELALCTESLEGLRILRCPVKKAGSCQLVVPSEAQELLPLIRHCLETELHANPRFEDFWCHLSFERTWVEPGTTQRVAGWHADGFQGVRVPPHQVEHSYIWCDTQPTEFCLQPFFVQHLDRARHSAVDAFERQAKEDNVLRALPLHLYLIDPYVVHRSPCLTKAGWRSFFRLTFTETELEDANNTRNLSLPVPQAYEERIDVRDRLSAWRGPVPWEMYGVQPPKP